MFLDIFLLMGDTTGLVGAGLVGDHRPQVRDGWIFYGLLALLVWAPMPLASNRTWGMGILAAWTAVLLVGVTVAWRRDAEMAFSRLNEFRWPLVFLGGFVLLAFLQTLPLPAGVVALLSPESYKVQSAAGLIVSALPMHLSIDVFQSRIFFTLSLVYFVAFALTALLTRDSARVETLAQTLVWSGLLQALIGVLLFSLRAHYQLFFTQLNHDRVIGTFVNYNHFAGYMEMCLSVGIGLMLSRLGSGKPTQGGWRQRMVSGLAFLISSKMRLRLVLVVMVIGLVLTSSRMGNTAFFASMLVVGLVAIALSRHAAPAMVALIVSLVVIDVFVIGTWVGLEKVVNRIQETTIITQQNRHEDSVEQRTEPAVYAMALVRDFPVFGSGGGSFYNAFARYRPPDISAFYDHAHNDYAEIACDTGLLGISLLGGVVVLVMGQALRVLYRRHSSLPRGMAFAGLMAIVALGIHSTVDFNLQIPANALTFTVILALAWSAAILPSRRKKVKQQI